MKGGRGAGAGRPRVRSTPACTGAQARRGARQCSEQRKNTQPAAKSPRMAALRACAQELTLSFRVCSRYSGPGQRGSDRLSASCVQK